jgi:molybdopterin adenylyltransferase
MSEFHALRIAVLSMSDSRSLADDSSGAYLCDAIQAAGHQLHARVLLPDDKYLIRAQISAWIAEPDVSAIICTGGTGFTGRDGAPEAIEPLLDKTMPGFSALMHQLSFAAIGSSTLQSRALAGLANKSFVFCLPGSRAACELAWTQIIRQQLDARTKPCNLPQLRARLRET